MDSVEISATHPPTLSTECKRESGCKRERECVRESVCVCVCVRESGRERKIACVRERQREWERETTDPHNLDLPQSG